MAETWNDKCARIFNRDAYRCKRCQKESSGSLSLHHIIPRELHGSDDDDNLITLCNKCHDWIELHMPLEPYLRTRIGIMNSMPSVNFKIIDLQFRMEAGGRHPGDKVDIWAIWVKQGRKGAKELIEKYGVPRTYA